MRTYRGLLADSHRRRNLALPRSNRPYQCEITCATANCPFASHRPPGSNQEQYWQAYTDDFSWPLLGFIDPTIMKNLTRDHSSGMYHGLRVVRRMTNQPVIRTHNPDTQRDSQTMRNSIPTLPLRPIFMKVLLTGFCRPGKLVLSAP